MTITLRLEKGSPLTIAEADGNMTELNARTAALEASGLPSRLTIESASFLGTQLSFNLSDDTKTPPVTVPRNRIHNTPVPTNPFFLTQNSFTLTEINVNRYMHFTFSGDTDVFIRNSTEYPNIPIDSEFTFFNPNGRMALNFMGGVTFNVPTGCSTLVPQGGTIGLKKVGENDWDVYGPLLPDGSSTETATLGNFILYRGNGGLNTIRTGGIWADLLILKDRFVNNQWMWLDSHRGYTKVLNSASNAAQTTELEVVTVPASGQFRLDSNPLSNTDGDYFLALALQWTDGAFTWQQHTGGGSKAHVHTAVPELIITKAIDAAEDWYVYCSLLNTPNSQYLKINSNNSVATSTTIFGNAAPTSTLINFPGTAGVEYISYMFSSVAGKSKVGRYSGTGNGIDHSITTGFRPKFLIVKSLSTGYWYLLDEKRDFTVPMTIGSRIGLVGGGNEEFTVAWVPNDTGFVISSPNWTGEDFIYLAVC